MPRQPRLTPQESEARLLRAGFRLDRTRGSHRIYIRNDRRVVVPFHSGKVLHPKVVKQVIKAIADAE